MCRKFIKVIIYRPCGCRESSDETVDCEDLLEDNCAGIEEIHVGSQTKKTRGNCPTHGEESKSTEEPNTKESNTVNESDTTKEQTSP